MKIIVEYDKKGNISSVAIPGSEFVGRLGLKPSRGRRVCEVLALELKGKLSPDSVRSIRENFRIRTSGKPALVHRATSRRK